MVLFDNEIKELLKLLDSKEFKQLEITDSLIEDVGNNNMIFSNEEAYELGGGLHKTLSFELPTSSDLVKEDKMLLLGKDLNEISEDEDFIRITLLNVKDLKLEGNALYNQLEKIKLQKYKVSPKGYMLRTATGDKEKVRVSKEFIKDGNFSKIGSAYIKSYKTLPFVNYVNIIFVTGTSPLYDDLKKLSIKKTEITDTIDHILKGMLVNDCDACSVKELCDEVQGLREIHKGN